ncbi:hypothetical protein CIPAW_07G065200 [Carya illinoinensis]|uniref:DUF4005 domain-containing protein n=1 Tax=Carya illinoinensis TaxID=32201 RepID=A0A8T1Q0C7_CARIL|nr:hypothetical protein CIPAW_07G065200 [Carya illinoinensis]
MGLEKMWQKMGKVSKWIRNFLVGKREKKYKKIDATFPAEHVHNKTDCQPGTPRTRRRWSFGTASGKKTSHKYSKSFYSFDTTKLPVQASAENEVLQNHAVLIADVEYAAATKIQAVFRSYLARKALSALRGLVKLQALVRGHQVRKQTNATLQRMHALISIQVRARVQRIQMAEEAHLHVKKQPSIHRNFTLDNELRRIRREKMDMNLQHSQGVSKCKSNYLNHSQIEKIEDDFPTYYSEDLSSRRRENPYEEYSFTANNSPQHYIPTYLMAMTHSHQITWPRQNPLVLKSGHRVNQSNVRRVALGRKIGKGNQQTKHVSHWIIKCEDVHLHAPNALAMQTMIPGLSSCIDQQDPPTSLIQLHQQVVIPTTTHLLMHMR